MEIRESEYSGRRQRRIYQSGQDSDGFDEGQDGDDDFEIDHGHTMGPAI